MALTSSEPMRSGENWIPASDVFCDGIEILLGTVVKKIKQEDCLKLKSTLNEKANELIIKHIRHTCRREEDFLWITFTAERSILNPRTMNNFLDILDKVQKHAEIVWKVPYWKSE